MRLIPRISPGWFRRGGRRVAGQARRRPTRRSPRSAAVALAVGVALAAGLSGALMLNFERSLSIRDPIYYHRATALDHRLKAGPRDFTVVALGSSRMHNAWLGRVVEEELKSRTGAAGVAFNMSSTGAGPIVGRLYLERLLARGVRPDHVVIELFPAMMIELDGAPFEARTLTAERVTAGELPTVATYGLNADALRADHAETVQNPWQALRLQLFERVDRKLIPEKVAIKNARNFDRWGSCPIEPKYAPVEQRPDMSQRMLGTYAIGLAAGRLSPHSVRAFEDLLDRCRELGIGATVVMLPEASYFRALYSPHLLSETRAVLGRTATNRNAAFIDAREWLRDEEFADGHHLLCDGAAEFTRRLCDERLSRELAPR